MRPEARTMIEAMSRHAVPLLLYPRDGHDIGNWLTGGTGVLVQTPVNRFIITAEHVVGMIESLREEQQTVTLLGGTGAPPVDISDWQVIDRSKILDICIIQVPEGFDPGQINKSFCCVDLSNIERAKENDEVLIIGFPSAHRTATGSVLNTRMLPIIDFVRSVSEMRFAIADPDNERQILLNPSDLDFPQHMGGASGAPVFRCQLDYSCELFGIFTDGIDGIHGVYLCTHANFATNSGVIDLLRLPPY